MTIKKELIGLMISVPSNIQSQLGESISVIADSDFWIRWDTLVDVSIYHHYVRYVLTFVGPGISIDSRQSSYQPRCVGGSPFDLQALETSVCVRRSIHRDKPCPFQIWPTFCTVAGGMDSSMFNFLAWELNFTTEYGQTNRGK